MATASAPALRLAGSAEAKEEAYPRKMESTVEKVDSAKRSQHETLASQEEPATSNPLLRACLSGDTEGVQQIFEDLEDPDHEKANRLLMEKDIVGRGLLYATCMAGQSDVIRTLARYGVDLKDKTARGYTLLHCAAAWGQLETLKTLIELEADIYATTSRGEKARDIACRYEQTECVALGRYSSIYAHSPVTFWFGIFIIAAVILPKFINSALSSSILVTKIGWHPDLQALDTHPYNNALNLVLEAIFSTILSGLVPNCHLVIF
ncbi:ankyrin repeat domain-containing protein 45-like [Lacerta agilis]|uniref:ankyrin repeat domain-containing protein 45-like n=1 Tax=Lacerta agilis TaxID=80427 RepID=UPI001419E584|nr:ankyrin repeat domain-containing protein 45-like [Lacerta agilis]